MEEVSSIKHRAPTSDTQKPRWNRFNLSPHSPYTASPSLWRKNWSPNKLHILKLNQATNFPPDHFFSIECICVQQTRWTASYNTLVGRTRGRFANLWERIKCDENLSNTDSLSGYLSGSHSKKSPPTLCKSSYYSSRILILVLPVSAQSCSCLDHPNCLNSCVPRELAVVESWFVVIVGIC